MGILRKLIYPFKCRSKVFSLLRVDYLLYKSSLMPVCKYFFKNNVYTKYALESILISYKFNKLIKHSSLHLWGVSAYNILYRQHFYKTAEMLYLIPLVGAS